MKTLKDYFDTDLLNWLRDNNLKYAFVDLNVDKGKLNLLYNDKFCLKLYDRMGHGYGVTINVADKYDESIYDNDKFSLTWVFKYLKIKETATSNNRNEDEYRQSLSSLISDIKKIVPQLSEMTTSEWSDMTEWIRKEALRQFA